MIQHATPTTKEGESNGQTRSFRRSPAGKGEKKKGLALGKPLKTLLEKVAGATGLEPATSSVTGWHSNH
jgi:hypothetical protein